MTEQELLNAAADGSWTEVEFYFGASTGWLSMKNVGMYLDYLSRHLNEGTHWRRKQQPKMAPLGPEDVLVTTQFRGLASPEHVRVNYADVSSWGVILNNGLVDWQELQECWLRTDDSGMTWKKCEKEEQQ